MFSNNKTKEKKSWIENLKMRETWLKHLSLIIIFYFTNEYWLNTTASASIVRVCYCCVRSPTLTELNSTQVFWWSWLGFIFSLYVAQITTTEKYCVFDFNASFSFHFYCNNSCFFFSFLIFFIIKDDGFLKIKFFIFQRQFFFLFVTFVKVVWCSLLWFFHHFSWPTGHQSFWRSFIFIVNFLHFFFVFFLILN